MNPFQLISGLVAWSINSTFTLLWAMLFCFHLRWRRGSIDLLLLVFFWVAFTSFYVLLLGSIGRLAPAFSTWISCIGICLMWIAFKSNLIFMFHAFKNWFSSLRSAASNQKILSTCLVLLGFLLIVRMAVHVLVWPPYVWDTLTYHLPKIADWIQYERIVTTDTPIIRSYFPATFELLQTWFALFFHHDFLIEAAGLPYYLIAILSVYALSRSLGLNRGVSAFTALIFAYTPSVVMHSVCAKNDIAIAALYLLIMATLSDCRHGNVFLTNRLVVILLALGMAIGIKPYILFISPGILLFGAWALFQAKQGAETPPGRGKKPPIAASLTLVTISLILGGYWYFRNWYLFDNPIYPVQFKMFGHVVFQGVAYFQEGFFRWASLTENLLSLLNERLFDSNVYTPDLGNMAGWGWFACSIGLVSLPVAAVVSHPYRWIASGFVLSLLLLLGWANSDPWYMRFTLWFPAVFALGFGVVLECITTNFFKRCFSALAVGCLLMNFLGTVNTGYANPGQWKRLIRMPFFERHAAFVFASSPAYARFEKTVPKGEAVGYFARGDSTIYCLLGSDFSRRLHYLNLRKVDDVTTEMERLGLNYLFVEAGPGIKDKIDALAAEGKIKKIAEGIYRRRQ